MGVDGIGLIAATSDREVLLLDGLAIEGHWASCLRLG